MTRMIAMLAACLALGACAATEATIGLEYAPMEGVAALADAASATVAVTGEDAREIDRAKVSQKINGYGAEMAAIRTSTDVAELAGGAVRSELAARGFTIGEGGAEVTVGVRRIYNQFEAGFWNGWANGAVQLDIAVADATGGEVFRKEYQGVERSEIMMASGENAKLSIESALRKAIAAAMADEAFLNAVKAAGRPALRISAA